MEIAVGSCRNHAYMAGPQDSIAANAFVDCRALVRCLLRYSLGPRGQHMANDSITEFSS